MVFENDSPEKQNKIKYHILNDIIYTLRCQASVKDGASARYKHSNPVQYNHKTCWANLKTPTGIQTT